MTNTVKKRDYILFAVCALICFLVFQQGDIRHTAGCSFAYLQGHILDFYEWNVKKEKYQFERLDQEAVLFMAGCFQRFQEQEWFVILTTQANASVSPVHHRMPLVLEKNEIEN